MSAISKKLGVAGVAALAMSAAARPGPDVVYSEINSVSHYGPVGGIHAYSLGTNTCNIGTANLRWGNSWNGSPAMAMNAYRLHDGRLLQVGLGYCKYACCAAAGSGCGMACNGVGGSMLGVGCLDVYGSGYNGIQSLLGPRSAINAYTGNMSYIGGSGNDIARRLQISEQDMLASRYPGALYFVEGVYVGSDDAPAGNSFNNASYKRVTIDGSYNMALQAPMNIGVAAIYAWRDHGLGVNQPDNRVRVQTVDVPNEGRFIVANKVTDRGNGTWTYDYAVFNLSSDRSAGSFSVAVPEGLVPSSIGFNDVNYHSGEPYAPTDWSVAAGASSITWFSPQTFQENANSNAVRWGTMYNFWFDSDRPPAEGTATIGLFKPHTTPSVDVTIMVPRPPCEADVNGDGFVNGQDFDLYVSRFEAGGDDADFNGDGFVNGLDFDEFVTRFEGGC